MEDFVVLKKKTIDKAVYEVEDLPALRKKARTSNSTKQMSFLREM